MIDKDAVRNNAKYLRNVRPIDPEEIAEYIEGGAHPAVVRQTLREQAIDLELFERDDGTFVPVETSPIPQPGWGPPKLPERYALALEDVLCEEFGSEWYRSESGDRLRERIRQVKQRYYDANAVEYDFLTALGYAIYHLPDYYATIGYVLDDLTENGLLDRTLRVLDVGAGAGGPALGLHDYLPDEAVVEYVAIEPSAAADVLDSLLAETGRNFRPTIRRESVESFFGLEDPCNGERAPEHTADVSVGRPPGAEPAGPTDDPFDLVVFGNVLSELTDPVSVVDAAIDALADDGSIVAIAPADRNTAIGLREVERAVTPLDSAVSVYSPTLRLWPDTAPSDRGWSFDVKPDLEVPSFQARLDAEAKRGPTDEPGEFINVDVQFAYSILRPDGKRRVDVRASPDRHLQFAQSSEHVTDRVNLLCVKLSHDLSDGANGLFRIGDGSEAVDHYAVCTRETSLNRMLREADYGSVLAVENVLVLWNDDEEAYNLVVDDQTVVDLVAP